MNLMHTIAAQLSKDLSLTVIRAEQSGDVVEMPYATYKLISDGKGFGREDVTYEDEPNELIERIEEERIHSVTFTVYAYPHTVSYDYAQAIRKWFARQDAFLAEHRAVTYKISDIINKSVYLTDAYEEKFGVDIKLRYEDVDRAAVDYFDKVEYDVIIERE